MLAPGELHPLQPALPLRPKQGAESDGVSSASLAICFFCDHFCVVFCVFRLESFIARIFIQHRLLVLLLTPLVNL